MGQTKVCQWTKNGKIRGPLGEWYCYIGKVRVGLMGPGRIGVYTKYDMPRVKDAHTWMLTWSPEGDCQELPIPISSLLSSEATVRCYAVAERSDKWHVHAGFELKRSFNSDYKWWKDLFGEGIGSPALDIRYHDNLLGLVGGYCSKDVERRVLLNKGFSDEDLRRGEMEYARGKRKQRLRKFGERYHVITPDKLEVYIGAAMGESNVGRDQAILALAKTGFAFARSCPGLEELYKADYLSQVQNETGSGQGSGDVRGALSHVPERVVQ